MGVLAGRPGGGRPRRRREPPLHPRASALRVSTTGFIPIAGKMCGVARSREQLRFIDTFHKPRVRKARGFFSAGAHMSRDGEVAKCEHLVGLHTRIKLRQQKVFIGIGDDQREAEEVRGIMLLSGE